ncbi:MAG: hypothetical protein KC621_05515 [Myxococcales bacterium]|nr:hypothetical protein [Myxococcales bacterium]
MDGTPTDWNGRGTTVTCARCGVGTEMSEEHWRSLLEAAHGVADLLGPDPEGAVSSVVAIDAHNPFAEEGAVRGSVQLAPLGVEGLVGYLPSDLRAWMAPGILLSPDDRKPLGFEVRGDVLRTNDASSVRRYGIDPRCVELAPPLLGAVSDEVERDREGMVAVVGAEQVVCGSCRSRFVLDGTEHRVKCSRCGELNHIPAAVRHAAQGEPRPDTWWLLFRGPSPYRRRLEGHGAPMGADRELQWEPAPQRARSPQEQLLQLAWATGVPLVALGFAGVLSVLVRLI